MFTIYDSYAVTVGTSPTELTALEYPRIYSVHNPSSAGEVYIVVLIDAATPSADDPWWLLGPGQWSPPIRLLRQAYAGARHACITGRGGLNAATLEALGDGNTLVVNGQSLTVNFDTVNTLTAQAARLQAAVRTVSGLSAATVQSNDVYSQFVVDAGNATQSLTIQPNAFSEALGLSGQWVRVSAGGAAVRGYDGRIWGRAEQDGARLIVNRLMKEEGYSGF